MTHSNGKGIKAGLICGLAVAAAIHFSGGAAFAQGNGNGRKPGGEESTMNLSYPANFYVTSLQSGVIGSFTLGGVFPTGMSYGCAVPETIGTSTFPNTSCVDALGTPLSPEACTCRDTSDNPIPGCNTAGAKCLNWKHADLERIYRQKNTANKWQAGYVTSADRLPAEYVDWGDNLEGKTWPIQVLRVETNTFSTIPYTVRFDNWHVFGQGTTELWGVHATNPAAQTDPPLPYVYPQFGFAVNVTSEARLNLTKLGALAAACPTTATGVSQSPYVGDNAGFFTKATGIWSVGSYRRDFLYGAELNIKGSYVYGYNWNIRNEPVTAGVNRAGWWRLTFYTPNDSVDFTKWTEPSPGINTLAPPLTTLTPSPIQLPSLLESEGESGLLLYVPQVDKAQNLTYLDICIKEGNAGGGGKK